MKQPLPIKIAGIGRYVGAYRKGGAGVSGSNEPQFVAGGVECGDHRLRGPVERGQSQAEAMLLHGPPGGGLDDGGIEGFGDVIVGPDPQRLDGTFQ